jgi:PAS domain S-box-containing protein
MSWVTIIWAMVASACLTLAALHLLVWCKKRTAWTSLLFALTAAATTALAVCEFWMMRGETPAEVGAAIRWGHVPFWAMMLSLVGFVRLHMRAGRPWLAWAVCVVRTLSLILNFLFIPNLNFREITAVGHVRFLGESVSIGEGVRNPWMLVGQASLLLLVIFVVDATVTIWRRGDERRVRLLVGTMVFFTVASTGQIVLALWGIIPMPFTMSLFFMPIVVAMGLELSSEVLRAAQLSEDLRESEKRLDLAADSAGVGLWSWDFDANLIWATERARVLYGFSSDEPIPFQRFLSKLHTDDLDWVVQASQKCFQEGADFRHDYRIVLPDGSIRWFKVLAKASLTPAGKPERMTGVSLDITERKQAEQEIEQQRNELAHLSRATTLSTLSGSLAHELNQPLGIILSNAQAAQELLLQDPPVVAEVSEILADIVAADRRAAEIIQRLRSLLKRGETSLQALPLNDLIEEVLRLLRAELIGRDVTAVCDLAPDLPPIKGDRVQLQQLVLNLILNAADAMAANAPGTRRLQLTTARSQHAVRVSVRDEGIGLPDNVERLFQPFFTTKAHGLGMGLAI